MALIDQSSSIKTAQNSPKLALPASAGHDLSKPEVPMIRMVRGADHAVTGDFNRLDVMESETSALAKTEMWTAKQIGTALVNKYPNRQWGVQINLQGGIMIISCPSLSTDKGYHIHMNGKLIDRLEKEAIRAGGEILERYGVNRNVNFDPEELESLDRDWQDEVISADAETTETL